MSYYIEKMEFLILILTNVPKCCIICLMGSCKQILVERGA